MKKILSKLMASGQEFSDWALLFLRLFAGCMMLTHGWAKLTNFTTLSAVFRSTYGVLTVMPRLPRRCRCSMPAC